jgi:putative ABC transport system permease protein
MTLFLSEATIIGMIGATVGILAGTVLGTVMISFVARLGLQGLSFSPVYTVNDLIFVWVFTVAISALAGLYPAWRASKLDPVVAFRKE